MGVVARPADRPGAELQLLPVEVEGRGSVRLAPKQPLARRLVDEEATDGPRARLNRRLSVPHSLEQWDADVKALYQRPPVLLFDEATSALDSESERAVKESLDELLADRTSFVIAHRLSTIRDADRILVLERGRLVEEGSHNELMERQGLYYYLASQQLEL